MLLPDPRCVGEVSVFRGRLLLFRSPECAARAETPGRYKQLQTGDGAHETGAAALISAQCFA
jgi:hypothetical protein